MSLDTELSPGGTQHVLWWVVKCNGHKMLTQNISLKHLLTQKQLKHDYTFF